MRAGSGAEAAAAAPMPPVLVEAFDHARHVLPTTTTPATLATPATPAREKHGRSIKLSQAVVKSISKALRKNQFTVVPLRRSRYIKLLKLLESF